MNNPNNEPPATENTYSGVRGRLRWTREAWGSMDLRTKIMLGGFVAGTAAGVVVSAVFEPSLMTVLKYSAAGAFVGVMVGLEVEPRHLKY